MAIISDYPDYAEGPITCACGKKFSMHWNGGELDQHDCSCGRKYYGEHVKTVMVMLEKGEVAPL
jgi:hypothetical protein